MIKVVVGVMIGICIGYLLYKPRLKYNKILHTLDPKGLDEESVQSLIEFINECIRKERLENIKGNKK